MATGDQIGIRGEAIFVVVRRMIHYPAPTYVVGIDEALEKGFIICVHGTEDYAISSIPTKSLVEKISPSEKN